MWKWNRAEVPQVQQGSTVLPTAQGWKNAQLLWKVPKPRRRLKMLAGLGLHTWLLQRQRPLFPIQGWIFFFFFLVFTRVLPSHRKKNCSAVWVFILAAEFFFFFPQVKPLFVICSCPIQPKVLGTPHTMSGFSKEHPNKKKGMELDVHQWHSPVSSHKQTPTPFLKVPSNDFWTEWTEDPEVELHNAAPTTYNLAF